MELRIAPEEPCGGCGGSIGERYGLCVNNPRRPECFFLGCARCYRKHMDEHFRQEHAGDAAAWTRAVSDWQAL